MLLTSGTQKQKQSLYIISLKSHRLTMMFKEILILWVFIIHGITHVDSLADNNTLTLGCSIPWIRGWLIGGQIGSAVSIAIEEVHRRQLLPGYEIEWIWRDSYCEPRRGMAMAIDMWASVDHLDGIIGDMCSVVCQPVSLLAAAWNIPVVSPTCSSPTLSDKSTYPTFSRLEGPGTVMCKLNQLLLWSNMY